MGCVDVFCSRPKWKEEAVLEHTFDEINVQDFRKPSVWMRFRYMFVFLGFFRGFLMYLADVATLIFLFMPKLDPLSGQNNQREAQVLERLILGTKLKDILPFLYATSFGLSLLLLAVDTRKARRIIRSKQISLAFTSQIAYRYYTLQAFAYFCLFERVNALRKFKDRLALFVFFRLRGWKRLLLVEAPRNAISVFVVYLLLADIQNKGVDQFFNGSDLALVGTGLLLLSTCIFAFSVLTTVLALYIYFPLVFDIRGNLKEYVCHKIDKRIARLIEAQERRNVLHGQIQRLNHSGAGVSPSSISSGSTGSTGSSGGGNALPLASYGRVSTAKPMPMPRTNAVTGIPPPPPAITNHHSRSPQYAPSRDRRPSPPSQAHGMRLSPYNAPLQAQRSRPPQPGAPSAFLSPNLAPHRSQFSAPVQRPMVQLQQRAPSPLTSPRRNPNQHNAPSTAHSSPRIARRYPSPLAQEDHRDEDTFDGEWTPYRGRPTFP